MTVKMTPQMEKLVEEELQAGDFETPEEVVLAGLVSLSCLHDQSDAEDFGAPNHLRMTSMDQLKGAIREGINNPGRKFSEADFADMGRELKEKGRISKV